MSTVRSQILNDAFENCNVTYHGIDIGNSDFLRENANIISELFLSDNIRRGIVMHPGSKSLFILSVVLAAFAAFVEDNEAFKLVPESIKNSTGSSIIIV